MRSVLILASSLTLAACSSVSMKPLTDPHESDLAREISRKYLPYAIMASDVYKTQGSGPFIGDKINSMNKGSDFKLFDDTFAAISNECQAINGKADDKKWLCSNVRYRNHELSEQEPGSESSSTDGYAKSAQDCNIDRPEVPVSALTELGWRRTVEIEKYALPKSWRIFVPDLAIEVWEKSQSSSLGDPELEYVISFRGTAGKGGWLSNLRPLTSFIPFFWDQYKQSMDSVEQILNQVYTLNIIRKIEFYSSKGIKINAAELMKSTPKPKITITGHSLGAALATYNYLRNDEIDAVIGFNPSPFDGRRSVNLDKDAVNKRLKDRRSTEIVYIVEDGEILDKIHSCEDGPIWGSEGGPTVKCMRVNFSRGAPIKQHQINRMACRMSVINRTE